MIPNIEKYYEAIANALVDQLPDEWIEARVTAIFYADSITWEQEFLTVDGKLRSFDISTELTNEFCDLRDEFVDAGKPAWGQATFELRSEGKFNMKWGYENCDENGDTIWDAEEWGRRHDERIKRLSQP